jgi:hypothetical protein
MGVLVGPLIPALAMLCSDYVVGKIRVWQTRLEHPEGDIARIAVVRSPEHSN